MQKIQKFRIFHESLNLFAVYYLSKETFHFYILKMDTSCIFYNHIYNYKYHDVDEDIFRSIDNFQIPIYFQDFH